MIGSITPLMREPHGGRKWASALVAYGSGSILASAAIGGLLGAMGRLLGGPWSWRWFALVIAVGALFAAEMGGNRFPGPVLHRQTHKIWRYKYGSTRAAFLWGVDLGLGFTTRVAVASYWALLAASFLLADAVGGAVLLGGYGLGRTLLVTTGPLAIDELSPGRSPFSDRRSWHRFHAAALGAMALIVVIDAYS